MKPPRAFGYTLAMTNEHLLQHVDVRQGLVPAILETVAVAGAVSLGAWAKIHLPFTPVPLTLQTFAVLVAAFAVSPARATAGVLLYTALGIAGAPLFAEITFGPSFGYIVGFALVPAIVRQAKKPAAGIVLATLAIYAVGVSWLSFWARISVSHAILAGVAPFIAGDCLKAIAAYGAARWLRQSSTTD